MRNVTDIRLEQLIVHLTNPWIDNGFVLSDTALPLDENTMLADYFVNHIENGLQDSLARAAKFSPEAAETATVCGGLLDGSTDLVTGSRILAERLYNILAHDRRISAGTFVVCIYSAQQAVRQRYLALLKLDPSRVFRYNIQGNRDGQRYVELIPQDNILPTTRERLHKSAFIQPANPDQEYELLLLDRQMKTPEAGADEGLVAQFFKSAFLGAEFALDSKERTKRMYKNLINAQNTLRGVPEGLEPRQEELLNQAITNLVQRQRVNLDAWFDELALPDNLKTQIDQYVQQGLPDREFEIDPQVYQDLIRKRRFRGEHGLYLTINADSYDTMVRVEINNDDLGPSYRIIIDTKQWNEVP